MILQSTILITSFENIQHILVEHKDGRASPNTTCAMFTLTHTQQQYVNSALEQRPPHVKGDGMYTILGLYGPPDSTLTTCI